MGEQVFERIRRRARDDHWDALPIGTMIGRIGMALQGTPYVGSTLELHDDREVCCINFAGLDCVTFYEIALGFCRMIRHGGSRHEDLVKEVTFTRYRGGRLDGYLSRLHYTSDWIDDNEKKGVVRNLTPNLLGATRMDKRLDFMSTHPQSYRQLRANPALVPRMAALERQIGARKPWYVPNDKVAAIEPLLETGDIVGIATSAEGLDCSHTGLVYVDESQVRRFLNASSVKKQVILGERLSEYAVKYKKNLGIMIARPL
ncbi:MAG: N-acetylmuramoyl-L-alanine amidase-like domain-containing protein [Fimbriimonadales bacterium]